MNTADLQIQLFQHIKARLAPSASVVDEVAQVLEISTDSAYRRIRGEKPLTIEEIYKLCTHYNLSLDNLFHLQSEAVLFKGSFIHPSTFKFTDYLKNVAKTVKHISSFKSNKMYYLCKDIPLFYHFQFKEIAAFKYYFWMKTLLHSPDFANRKFSFAEYPDELFELGQQALHYYNQIDSVEFWNIEGINSTIRQIQFYSESHVFTSTEDVYRIYEALERLVIHLEKQADAGYKFNATDPAKTPQAPISLYFNEVMLGDNSILAITDNTKMAFLIHNVMNYMTTTDTRFCDNFYDNIQNLMRKSTLISAVSERERSRFFKYLYNRIANRKQNL